MKKLRIAVQFAAFVFLTLSFLLLSSPFKFPPSELIFLTSISANVFPQISSLIFQLGHLFLILIFIVIALLLGRVFCGWICPFGAAMDFFAFALKPFRKWKESEPSKKQRSKYILFLALAAFAVLGFQFVWIFEPITVFSRFVQLALFPFINTLSDGFFEFLIMKFNVGSDLYNTVQNSIFDARRTTFNHSFVFFVLFAIPILAVLIQRRFWCRYICPLGAGLGFFSKKARFGLGHKKCANACGRCRDICPTNAIKKDGTINNRECVMCMDCLNLTCRKVIEAPQVLPDEKGISRRQFLFWGAGFVSTLIVFARKSLFSAEPTAQTTLIRPPGALRQDEDFNNACIRCGNCMKICITNGIQPSGFEAGLTGLWTPKIDKGVGYCEYECNACGLVCPTHAIVGMPLDEKKKFKMGQAIIKKNVCIPWSEGVECLVCEEMCPIPNKAIFFSEERINGNSVQAPNVSKERCVGCGICQNKCPVIGKEKGIFIVRGAPPK